MFKNLLAKIKMMQQERKYKRNIDLNCKRFYIRNAVIKWYMDYDQIYDVCDIPAHIRAERAMNKTIKRPSDIDRIYKKLIDYEKSVA